MTALSVGKTITSFFSLLRRREKKILEFDACHHLTRWGCKASSGEVGHFFPHSICASGPLDQWPVVSDVGRTAPNPVPPKQLFPKTNQELNVHCLSYAFCIIKLLKFCYALLLKKIQLLLII